MTGMATLEQIQRMPKLELHIHLEGTFDPETVCLLAEMQGISLPRPRQHLFDFSGLSDFLDLLDWICSLVQNRETAQQIAYRHAKYAQEQGILYTAIIVNPSHWKNIRTGELLTGVLEGFDQAGADGLPDCRLLVSLRREQDTASARRTIEWILSHRHPRLVGVSVDGNEARTPTRDLRHYWRERRRPGWALPSMPASPLGRKEFRKLLNCWELKESIMACGQWRT